jgi:spermidine/putrescine transport system permease protein
MMSRGRKPLWPRLVVAGCLAFLYLPLFMIALMSFNAGAYPTLPIRGLTLDWYAKLLSDERFVETSLLSLKLAAISTVIAVALGTAGAFGVALGRGVRYRVVGQWYVVPMLVPALVLAVAMATSFRWLEIRLSFWTMVAGHVVVHAPLVYLIVTARLKGFDWSLVQAARTLGATRRQALRRVTMPLVVPAVAGGAILSFALSLDNFVISLFLTGGDSTIPLLIWSMMRAGFSPSVNALATVLVVITLFAAVVAERLSARR